MRRLSEIICEQIMACCELNRTEHGKMDEFSKSGRDCGKIMELDALMRINNEKRRTLWNELNETFSTIIENKKYEWKDINNRK